MGKGYDKRIETLVREKTEGKSYSTIREELSGSGMSDAEISKLIRQVDERVLSETVRSRGKEKVKQWYRIGLILAIAGLVLSIAYNAGILLQDLPSLLVYSPFLVGILFMLYARTLQRQQFDPPDRGTGAIRRRRPYK